MTTQLVDKLAHKGIPDLAHWLMGISGVRGLRAPGHKGL